MCYTNAYYIALFSKSLVIKIRITFLKWCQIFVCYITTFEEDEMGRACSTNGGEEE
jgi:hypothetical protein